MAEKKPALIDNPGAPEIYADRTTGVSIRGNVARISLASERAGVDATAPEAVVSGHLAMSVRGFIQLYAQMQSVVRQMEASGMLKAPVSANPSPAKPKKKAAAKSKSATSGSRRKSKKS